MALLILFVSCWLCFSTVSIQLVTINVLIAEPLSSCFSHSPHANLVCWLLLGDDFLFGLALFLSCNYFWETLLFPKVINHRSPGFCKPPICSGVRAVYCFQWLWVRPLVLVLGLSFSIFVNKIHSDTMYQVCACMGDFSHVLINMVMSLTTSSSKWTFLKHVSKLLSPRVSILM